VTGGVHLENLNSNIFNYYLVAINVIGFILFAINTYLYTYTEDKQVDKFLTLTAFLGGSLGILIAIILIDRKAVKPNMMSRVFIFSIFIIQLILLLYIKGFHKEHFNFSVIKFFTNRKLVIIYLIAINIVTFIAFAIDKHNAIEGKTRIKIVTLLTLAFIGGSIGGWSAMYIFRHKTKGSIPTKG
jgi:uncharacterized membrane protein YsdA (DUF1294 family)